MFCLALPGSCLARHTNLYFPLCNDRLWQELKRVERRSAYPNAFPPLSCADTFASKVAAIGDETADNSVGNVTGSNAVNVFLGIGIAWSIAAIYWESQGLNFEVSPGRHVRIEYIGIF